ncbi:MAG: ABC transporter ATP-binding protein/permease, partial [Acholeplasmatales bacterium]|nr:ABC transporter ATP-binding protein/permease [Acholeplasmatales bacterium]
MKLIFKILKPFRKILSYSLVLKGLGAGVDLFIPWLIALIIELAKKDLTAQSIKMIIIYSALIILIATLGLVFNYISNRKSELISSQATAKLRYDLFSHILSLDSQAIDKYSTSSIISRMTTDTYNIYQSAAGLQRMAIRAPILLLTGIIISLIISPILSLIMIGLLPIIVVISYFISKKGIIKYHEVQVNQDELIRVLRENINGARVIKALSTTQYEINRFNEVNSRSYQANLDSTKTIAKTKPIMDIIMNIGLTATIFVGALLIFNNFLSVESSQILTYVTNFTIILNAMLVVTRIFSMVSRASASASRINEVMATTSKLQNGQLDFQVNAQKPFIEFQNVSFSYNAVTNNLKNISFSLNKGESLGIIGPTGAGKTTLINLLMRFYEFEQGHIFIYG